jgi:hypothetical protein
VNWSRAYEDNGDLKPPRTTAFCYSHMHFYCEGRCTPPKEYLLPTESTHETVACECACHPVVVAP